MPPPRDSKGRLLPGSASLNPQGRPKRKALEHYLDMRLGIGAVEAYDLAIKVMRGEISAPARRPGPHEDAASASMIPLVPPTIKERVEAAQWLAEQRNGKAPASVDIEVDDGPRRRMRDLSKLTDAELEAAETLLAKAEIVEGELVSARSLPEGGPPDAVKSAEATEEDPR